MTIKKRTPVCSKCSECPCLTSPQPSPWQGEGTVVLPPYEGGRQREVRYNFLNKNGHPTCETIKGIREEFHLCFGRSARSYTQVKSPKNKFGLPHILTFIVSHLKHIKYPFVWQYKTDYFYKSVFNFYNFLSCLLHSRGIKLRYKMLKIKD